MVLSLRWPTKLVVDVLRYCAFVVWSYDLGLRNKTEVSRSQEAEINPLSPKLNPICYLLALLGAHHFLHLSRIRVKLLTFRLLMSYIYI